MPDSPWQGDACSLVDAFRAGERSPVEELEATLVAIEASDLNAFTFVDADRARDTAKQADVSLPFGGVLSAHSGLTSIVEDALGGLALLTIGFLERAGGSGAYRVRH